MTTDWATMAANIRAMSFKLQKLGEIRRAELPAKMEALRVALEKIQEERHEEFRRKCAETAARKRQAKEDAAEQQRRLEAAWALMTEKERRAYLGLDVGKNRARTREIRARMERTGESYTQAMRAIERESGHGDRDQPAEPRESTEQR